jgi:hypothetical protein
MSAMNARIHTLEGIDSAELQLGKRRRKRKM